MSKAGGEVDGFSPYTTISQAFKSNFWAVQAAVTGESLEACDERFTRNDTQISKSGA
jgi:hypothetical protein